MATHAAGLSQDPHRSSKKLEKSLELAIGRTVRSIRKERGITVADLSRTTGISIGMLSKIENGATSPSLTSLQTLASGLSVQITEFFVDYEQPRQAVHVKSGTGVETQRAGTRAGHQYNLLGHLDANNTGVVSEPYIITLSETSDVFPTFQHDGIELIYMLSGSLRYRHGDNLYNLSPGDSLFFDANAPHGPEDLISLPAQFLSIICYPQ